VTSVSVIVPARDAAATIGATLDALTRQKVPATEVIVVDDGSADGTAELVRGHPLGTRLIERERGQGPGEARNVGAAVAVGEVLAFTDADCTPDPDWLEAGAARLQGADLVQGRVEPDSVPGPFDRTISVRADRGLFETANLFVKRDLFERLGGFEDFIASSRRIRKSVTARHAGRGFGEDALFGWRARREGAVVAFAPEVSVGHAVFPGRPLTLLSERWRLRYFPALAKRVPELRRSTFFARAFLSRRTAAFDLALACAAVAAAIGVPLLLLGAVPYGALLLSRARRAGRLRLVPIAAVDLVGDMIGALALIFGSATYRSLLV
jgi:glycosyltransferase involved in cell wall biosynthesis